MFCPAIDWKAHAPRLKFDYQVSRSFSTGHLDQEFVSRALKQGKENREISGSKTRDISVHISVIAIITPIEIREDVPATPGY